MHQLLPSVLQPGANMHRQQAGLPGWMLLSWWWVSIKILLSIVVSSSTPFITVSVLSSDLKINHETTFPLFKYVHNFSFTSFKSLQLTFNFLLTILILHLPPCLNSDILNGRWYEAIIFCVSLCLSPLLSLLRSDLWGRRLCDALRLSLWVPRHVLSVWTDAAGGMQQLVSDV